MGETYVLIETDGYSITTMPFPNKEQAQKEMSDRYNRYYPEVNDESSEEMSELNEMDAMLYANSENVFVWSIIAVKTEKLEVPVGNHKICAEASADPNYPGISLYYTTTDNSVIDLAYSEIKSETDEIHTYIYEDMYEEGWTKKFTHSLEEADKA